MRNKVRFTSLAERNPLPAGQYANPAKSRRASLPAPAQGCFLQRTAIELADIMEALLDSAQPSRDDPSSHGQAAYS